jgi:hypothetical protein
MLDVRFWHKADIPTHSTNVCFWGKADIGRTRFNAASDRKRTYSVPFDHLVGAGAGSPRPPRCRHDMLTKPQEANLVTYNVGLCRMVNGNLDAPYEGASIEAANIPDALLKAKKWAASVEVADNSWLQILLDGRSVRSLKPGSF